MNAPETTWYPTADELLLIKVPQSKRLRIRERLRPWLSPLRHPVTGEPTGVAQGRCFEVAQALVMTAQDSSVQYIEGVYIDPWALKHDASVDPDAHAWVKVDGFYVDLIDELLARQSGSNRGREYQELHLYSYREVKTFIQDCKPTRPSSIAAWSFTSSQKLLNIAGLDHDGMIELFFRPTKQALKNRIKN